MGAEERMELPDSANGDVRVRAHRDLEVWRMSMDLAQAIYRLTAEFPKQEEYRITSQLIRAAISIPANIAEGNARGTRKDYAHFISIARGSTAELETLLLLAQRAGFDRNNAIAPIIETNERIGRMLTSLRAPYGAPLIHAMRKLSKIRSAGPASGRTKLNFPGPVNCSIASPKPLVPNLQSLFPNPQSPISTPQTR